MIEGINIICDICGHYEQSEEGNVSKEVAAILNKWTLVCPRCINAMAARQIKDLTRGP